MMKNNLKNKKIMRRSSKGITLIALVITIIVLLILAGISISMLSGDNSILSRAGQARDITEEKSIAERVQLAYLGALATGQGEATEEGLTTALNSEFESGKYTLAQDLSKVTIDGKDYNFDGTVAGGDSGSQWTQDSEGKIVSSDGKVKLQIGDYVNYSAVAGVDTTDTNNTTIKSNGTDNGYGDQTFDLTKYTGDNKWRVLGIKDGKVELISADIVPSNNSNEMYYLKGRTGFQNAETELTNIAGLYGQGTHATGARSVNVDDINKITGYNPNAEGIKNPTAEQIASGNKFGKNKIYEYGNEVTYSWDGTNKPKYTSTNGASGNLLSHNVTSLSFGNFQKAFSWYDFSTNSWKKSPYTSSASTLSPVEITNLTGTDYYYYPETLSTSNDTTVTIGIANNSTKRDMLFNNTDSKYYWLASRCVYADSGYVLFGVRFVYDGNVRANRIACSYGKEFSDCSGVRPVVSLASDIQLEPNGTNAWKFKQ